jgi:hypothetical protein
MHRLWDVGAFDFGERTRLALPEEPRAERFFDIRGAADPPAGDASTGLRPAMVTVAGRSVASPCGDELVERVDGLASDAVGRSAIAITGRLRGGRRHAPARNVGYEAELSAKGERLIWVERPWLDKLDALRGPGESYSDVILGWSRSRWGGEAQTQLCTSCAREYERE